MRIAATLGVIGLLSSPASAADLAPGLAGLSFLLGDWIGEGGKVAETGSTSRGGSHFTAEAGGGVLLRRDHTELADPAGKPAGGFDQIMMIYPEGGTLHADYADGRHVIHYDRAAIEPGQSVTFTSVAGAGPVFRLAYRLVAPGRVSVSFGMTPPGGTVVQAIAEGMLVRAP